GVLALGLYGFVATLQPDPHFGRILAAYGGVFVAGSLAWGMAVDGFRPDRYDLAGQQDRRSSAGRRGVQRRPPGGHRRPYRAPPGRGGPAVDRAVPGQL